MENIINYCIVILENILLVGLFNQFICVESTQYSKNCSIGVSLILSLESAVLSGFLVSTYISMFFPLITLFIYAHFIVRYKQFFKTCIYIALIMINLLLIKGVILSFGSMITGASYITVQDNYWISVLLSLSSNSFLLIEFLYLKNTKNKSIELTKSTWIIILTILVLSILMLSLAINKFMIGKLSLIDILISTIVFISINILIVYLCILITKNTNELKNQDIFIESIAYETKLLDIIKEKTEELSKVNHDFKHHIAVLQQMLENNTDTAKQYLNSITLPKSMEYIHTENVVLNYILNDKISLAKSKNINVRRSVIGNTSDFYINNIDISIILGNLLDNAIEACALVCENPFIDIEIIVDQYKTVITIKNSTILDNKETNEKLMTTKLDKKHHGYGMKNIETVVNKYQGEDFYSVKNHVFTHICIVNNIEE